MAEEKVPDCGTIAAVSRHRRRGEDLDEACAVEQRMYHQRRRAEGLKRPSSRTIDSRATMALRERARRVLGERHQRELIDIMKELRASDEAGQQHSEETGQS